MKANCMLVVARVGLAALLLAACVGLAAALQPQQAEAAGYTPHLQSVGWKDWFDDETVAATSSQPPCFEAIFYAASMYPKYIAKGLSGETTHTTTPLDDLNDLPQPGDYITFGNYEQDNNTSNGKEPIEWFVLDVDEDNNKALVVSKYALDCQYYHGEDGDPITWEKCDLRYWLNGDFLLDAFTGKERLRIPYTTVHTPDNPTSGQPGGNDTSDQIFLLSIGEVRSYFFSNGERMCVPTAYAVAQGAEQEGSADTCVWWMRSPGYNIGDAAFVTAEGLVNVDGDSCCDRYIGVRPAMWLNL